MSVFPLGVNPSYFRSLSDRAPYAVTWDEVYRLVHDDERVRANTLRARAALLAGDKDGYSRLKQASGAITPAACCEGGHARRHVTGYTLCSHVDIDHIPADRLAEVTRRVKADAHTFMAWVTASGEGLRVIYRCQPPEHDGDDDGDTAFSYQLMFRVGNDHYSRLTGLPVDEHCKDSVRLSFLAHDGEALYRPSALPFDLAAEQAYGWAAQQAQRGGASFEPHRHNDFVMRVAYQLNRYGLAEDDAVRVVLEHCAAYAAAESVVRSCYRQTAEHGERPCPSQPVPGDDAPTAAAGAQASPRRRSRRTAADVATATVGDICAYLSEHVLLRYNRVNDVVEWGARPADGDGGAAPRLVPITDRDVNSLWRQMGRSGLKCRRDDLWAIISSDYVPTYDPFVDWMEALPAWDPATGGDPIGELAAHVHTTGPADVFADVLRKWLVGVVASLLRQSVNQTILVLIGRQGIYKTTFMRYLLPPAWRDRYFYTKTNSSRLGKDDVLALSEYALICLEEIDHMRPDELNQLKAMVTLEDIHERPAYGRVRVHRRHIASFCATGNNLSFLTDPTGNRRWLPFEVTAIDDPYRLRIDYAAVYGQALYLLRSGFSYWFSQSETAALNARNVRFEVPSMEQELIARCFRHPQPGEVGFFKSATDILEHISAGIRTPLSVVRVGAAMSRLGYERIGLRQHYGYIVVPRMADEIMAAQKADALAANHPEQDVQADGKRSV